MGGGDALTLHLREDRRHIQDRDVVRIREMLTIPMNLEMAVTDEMIAIAQRVLPQKCCLVPEKRQELTTEGGLDILNQESSVKRAVHQLRDVGIEVSLFIDPQEAQIAAAVRCGAHAVEIHTGSYAAAMNADIREQELARIKLAARMAQHSGLIVNAGHGLHYHNVQQIAAIAQITELNIGHAIVARALFSGLRTAVHDMKICINHVIRENTI